ncbi:hypothetical protein [Xanthomonas vesicatoria]|uniref:hypothetical protein n=1 Tax=Xanthomonas vesicatoria TaxID=56460 RepID=UPI001E57BCC3|nr:hypothetical protein [Xanthomonas vesicatoria]MCC8616906.1 hypothetical protein [Xanthomonas vesicatoria]
MKTHIRSLWTSLILLIAVLTSTSAGATGDVLSFETGTAGYSFLVSSGGGPGGIGGLVMTWPEVAERGLPSGSTQWYFKPTANHMRIIFTNPGRTDLPPSFTLEIKGKRGTLKFDKRTIKGKAYWRTGSLAEY